MITVSVIATQPYALRLVDRHQRCCTEQGGTTMRISGTGLFADQQIR